MSIINLETAREVALSLPGVTEDFPFGEDVLVLRIEGKIFMAIAFERDEPAITLKLLPERNEELRERYSAVRPAFHWNKKHWSDIHLQSTILPSEVFSWIEEAYHLVRSLLPKRVREKYSG